MKTTFVRKLILALAVLQGGCRLNGTGTGNPYHSPHSGVSATIAIERIVAEVCTSTIRCHTSADYFKCISDSAVMIGYAGKVGALKFPNATVDELKSLEVGNHLTPNIEVEQDCRQQIRSLDCEVPEMKSAFISNAPHPYQNTIELLRPSCEQVFK